MPWLIGWSLFAVIVTGVLVVRVERSSDFRDFWRTALEFRQTGQIRSDLGVHNYLPAFVILTTPLSLLPLPIAAAVFSIGSFGFFAFALFRFERAADLRTTGPSTAAIVAALLSSPYIVSGGVLGTFGLLLASLILLAETQRRRGRDAAAGALIGLGAVLKVLPIALLAMYAFRGRWRSVLGGTASVVVLGGILPLACIGPQRFVDEHVRFRTSAVEEHSPWHSIHAEKPPKANYSNNALPMTLRRLFSPLDARKGESAPPILVNAFSTAPPTIQTVYISLALLIASATLFATRLWHRASARISDPIAGEALLLGTWCGAMLLASPLLWTHYLVLAFPALWALALQATRGRSRIAPVALLAWLAGAALLASPHARAAGAQILSVLLVWTACVAELLRVALSARVSITQQAGDS